MGHHGLVPFLCVLYLTNVSIQLPAEDILLGEGCNDLYTHVIEIVAEAGGATVQSLTGTLDFGNDFSIVEVLFLLLSPHLSQLL